MASTLKRAFLLRLTLLLLSGSLQVGLGQPSPLRTTAPVKQFAEFLKRFYYEQTPDQQPLTSDSLRTLYPRRAYLLQLFDAKDARRIQPDYQRAVQAFVAEMTETPPYPADPSANLFAETSFRASYRGKAEALTAYWQRVRVNKAQGWRLIGLVAPFLAGLNPADTSGRGVPAPSLLNDTLPTPNRPLTLAPNVHETSFLAFQTTVEQGQNVEKLLSDSLAHTALGHSFVLAVRRRELILTETERVSLFLRTGSRWVVRVDEFPRDDENSGWLISDLYGPLSPSRLPVPLMSEMARRFKADK